MTKKKVTIVLDGNQRRQESVYHELSKIVDDINAEPEINASIQSESLEDKPEQKVKFSNEH